MVPRWYWTPEWFLSKDDSRTVLISGNFRDPEGAPVYFDSGGGNVIPTFGYVISGRCTAGDGDRDIVGGNANSLADATR